MTFIGMFQDMASEGVNARPQSSECTLSTTAGRFALRLHRFAERPAHRCESLQTGSVSGVESELRFEVLARAFIGALFVEHASLNMRG